MQAFKKEIVTQIEELETTKKTLMDQNIKPVDIPVVPKIINKPLQMIEESKGPHQHSRRGNDPSQRLIKDGSLKTRRPNDASYEMSDEEFTTYQPKIMAIFKLNNRRKKAKAAFLAARADYEAVKAELSRTKASHMKMYEEINSDDTPNEASI